MNKAMREIKEMFGSDLVKKFKKFDDYSTVSWNDNPTETLTDFMKFHKIKFKIHTIGDADIIFFKASREQRIGAEVLKMLKGDYTYAEQGLNLEGILDRCPR